MSSESPADERFYDALTHAIEVREAGSRVDFDRLAGGDADLAARLRRILEFDDTVDCAFALLRDGRSSAVNRAVGAFQLIEEIGGGASARVFLARDDRLHRFVALKEFGRNAFTVDPSARTRFRREARLAASLDHSGIVPIYEVGERDDEPWIAMKLLTGPSLAGLGPVSPQRAAEIGRSVAETLAFAHGRGVIHRDIKPANIILDLDRPVLVDFGLARSVADTRMTREGQIPGTLPYLAPELILDPEAVQGESSDLYALGATLYELIAGEPPFGRDQPEKVLQRLAFDDAKPLALSRRDRDFERIVQKCLAKEPRLRYASATELADDLARFLSGEPIVGRAPGRLARVARFVRHRRGVVAALLVALLAIGGWTASEIFDRIVDDRNFEAGVVEIEGALAARDLTLARHVLKGIDGSRRRSEIVSRLERRVAACAATEDLLDLAMGRRELLSPSEIDGCLAAARSAAAFEDFRHDYHAAAAMAEMFRGNQAGVKEHVLELSKGGERCRAIEVLEALGADRQPTLDAPILHEQDHLISILVLRAAGASIEERRKLVEIAREARPKDARLIFSAALLSMDSGAHEKAAAAFEAMADSPRLEPLIRRHEARSRLVLREFDRARKSLSRIPPAARRPIDVVHELTIDAWMNNNDRVRDGIRKNFGDGPYIDEPDVGLFVAQWKDSVGDVIGAVAILREISEKAKWVLHRHLARADLIILLLDLWNHGKLSAEDTEDMQATAEELAEGSKFDVARSRGLYVGAMLGEPTRRMEMLTRSAEVCRDEYYPRLQIALEILTGLLGSRPLGLGMLLDEATKLTDAEQSAVDLADRRLREVEEAAKRADRPPSDSQWRHVILLRLFVGAYRRDRERVIECLDRVKALSAEGRWPETEGAPFVRAYRDNFGR